MGAVEIKPGIYWVGAIDWAVRDFHGYITPNGTTYNNYLILDKHVTLVDTVKHDFSRIHHRQHPEPRGPREDRERRHQPHRERPCLEHRRDHGTGAERAIHITERGKKGLDRFFDTSRWKFRIVKTGRYAQHGHEDHHVPRNADAPLAGLHDELREGGQAPDQPGRLRPAPCVVGPVRRRVLRPVFACRPSNTRSGTTTPTS